MGGLSAKMPLTFWTYVIGAAALAGVPPLAGFWSKDEILAEAFYKGVEGGAWPFALAFWLLLIAAFLTAFYMTRQVLMIFFGHPRHTAAMHAPESPHVMTYVMAVLAFFAVITGLENVAGAFTAWLAPEEHFVGMNPIVVLDSVVAAAAGIGLGYLVYRPRKLPSGVDDPLRSLGFVFAALNAKYKVDELYDFLFVRPFKALSDFLAYTIDERIWHDGFHDSIIVATFKTGANFLANLIDPGIIDGTVNGLARLIQWCAAQLRRTQTGYVRNYALSVLLGVVVIVTYLALK
jgi:NADH-quinone oxidoreductase subunit L